MSVVVSETDARNPKRAWANERVGVSITVLLDQCERSQ
jgi:hypothetical protein